MLRRVLAKLLIAIPAVAQERSIAIASTASTEQSGLIGQILPAFRAGAGITTRVAGHLTRGEQFLPDASQPEPIS